MTYHVNCHSALIRLSVKLLVLVVIKLFVNFYVHLMAHVSVRLAEDSVSAGDKDWQEGLNPLQYVALRHHGEIRFHTWFCKQTFNHLNASFLFHFFRHSKFSKL